MKQKILDFIKKRKIASGAIVISIITIIYWGISSLSGSSEATIYTAATVTKGTITTSVSGSGQVSALNQVDINSKVSGEVTKLAVKNGQEIAEGQIIAYINSRDALNSVRDAELALESANLAYEKLIKSVTDADISTAENAVNQAERDLEQAKRAKSQQELETTQSLESAYEDSFSAISSTFLEIPDIMDDMDSIRGSYGSPSENIGDYKLILGENSQFISAFEASYTTALELYDKTFAEFKDTPRTTDETTLYDLLGKTYSMTKTISQAFEDARNMLDKIVTVGTYQNYSIATTVDSLRPIVSTDISTINSEISTLQNIKDTIDTTNQDAPINLQKADDNIATAEETLKKKQSDLEELRLGADPLDIKSQQLTIRQKQNALSDAREQLSDFSVKAPFAGIIAETSIEEGATISSNTTVATLITKKRIAEVSLNEVDVSKVAVGQKATLTFDAIDELSISGEVGEIDILGTVSQGVVTYGVKILFDTQDERVKPGMSVNAEIITEIKQDILLIPNSAIKTQGNANYVEMFTNTTSTTPPQQQTIETGISNDTSTEIISGLKEGDQIIEKTSTTGATTTTTSSKSIFGGGGGGSPMMR